MLFDEYQTAQQVWRYGTPTDVFVSGVWNASDYEVTSSSIILQDFFNASNANINIGFTCTSGMTVSFYLEVTHDVFINIKDVTVVSGTTLISHTIQGNTSYKGFKLSFTSGIPSQVSYIYIGDKTYATKDDEFVDGIWKRMPDITGRIESILGLGYQSLKNDQTFNNITELDYVPYEYKSYILPSDGIIDADGTQYRVVGPAEVSRQMLECVVLHLERTQWNMP